MKLYGINTTYRSEEGGDGGSNDGGTPDAGTPDAGAGTPDAPAAPTAEAFAELQAQFAALTADKAESDAAAEAARVAALSDADKLAEDRAAFTAEADAMRADLRGQRREAALDKLDVLPNYRKYVGDHDPSTTEGAAALEAWAKEHPEALRQKAAGPAPWVPAPLSALAKIARGEVDNPLVPRESVRKLFS
jgi:hypothetical protein